MYNKYNVKDEPIQDIGTTKNQLARPEESAKWLSMSDAALLTPYSAEYLSLLARKKKIASKKIGNAWYTTKAELDSYMRRQMVRVQISNGSKNETFSELEPWRSYGQDVRKYLLENELAAPPVYTAHVEQALEKVLDKKFPISNENSKLKIENFPGTKHFKVATSSKVLIAATLAAIVLFSILPVPFVFSFVSRSVDYVREAINDANTVMGFRPGTHANEILLLDKEGNISIMGHIETEGQLKSFVVQGIAPIVVDSTTTVENLSADSVDGTSSEEFTLAFVTENGNVTAEDVYLNGNVEVGSTLEVKGATELLSTLEVKNSLKVWGEAEFKQALEVMGPAYFEMLVTLANDAKIKGNLEVDKNITVKGGVESQSSIIGKGGLFGRLGVSGSFSAGGKITLGSDDETLTINAKNVTIDSVGNAAFDGSLGALSLSVTDLSATNATTTNLFSTTASSTNLFFTTGNGGNFTSTGLGTLANLLLNASSTLQNFTFVNATGTSATTTSLFSSQVTGTNIQSTNLDFTSATGTSATTTNFFSTTASSTNLFSNNFNFGAGSINALTLTGHTVASLGNLNIGSSGTRFGTIYADIVDATSLVGTVVTGSTSANDWTINSDNATADTENMTLAFERGSATPNALLTWDSANDRFTFNSDVAVLSGIGNGSLLVNSSTTLQNFTFVNATGTSATTTNFFTTNASSTDFRSNTGTFGTLSGGSLTVSNLTSGRIPFASTAGLLSDSTGLLWDNTLSRLTATNAIFTTSTTTSATSTNSFATTASSTNLFATALTAGDSTLGAITSGLINSQTISSAANFTGTLTVTGGLSTLSNLLLTGSSTLQNFTFVNATGTSATTTNFFATTASSTNLFSSLLTVGGNGLVIDSSRNVGIGTTSPQTKLHVYNNSGDGAVRVEGSTTNSGYINFRDASAANSNAYIGVENSTGGNIISGTTAYSAAFGTAGAKSLHLGTNNATRLTIDSSGNVGIGTTTPNNIIDVYSTSKSAVGFSGASGSTYKWTLGMDVSNGGRFSVASSTALGTTDRLVIDGNGNVGIGTTNPGSKLAVNGSFAILGSVEDTSQDATGGTITHSGGYTIHTFTSSGTFTMNSASTSVEVLVIGGGGGGFGNRGGGGGAGGYQYNANYSVSAQAYTVTVGAGGAAGNWNQTPGSSNDGGNSVFGTITATGGGSGGVPTQGENGRNGGSGGGAAGGDGDPGSGGTGGTGSQGSNGGNGGSNAGAGGGGASAAGASVTDGAPKDGGNGGAGTANSISGASVTYAGGGGGGGSKAGDCTGSVSGGTGGAGGGGNGSTGNGSNGTANTGGGGGGGGSTGGTGCGGNGGLTEGGAGGSGIVIIRYRTPTGIGSIFTITSAGLVGIGTTAPDSIKLDVEDDIEVGTGTTGCVRDADNTTLVGSCVSDERLKKNITELSSDTLEKVAKLRPVIFEWRNDEYPWLNGQPGMNYGLIAQEVEEVFPDMVNMDDKDFKRVSYDISLTMRLLQAIKELYAELLALRDEMLAFAERFVSKEIVATEKICIGNTCVNEQQLIDLLASTGVVTYAETRETTNDQQPTTNDQQSTATSTPATTEQTTNDQQPTTNDEEPTTEETQGDTLNGSAARIESTSDVSADDIEDTQPETIPAAQTNNESTAESASEPVPAGEPTVTTTE